MNTKSLLIPNLNSPRVPRSFWSPVLVVVLFAGLLGVAHGQTGSVPDAINYQGKLTTERGEPVKSGLYQVKFKIWKVAENDLPGDLVWSRVFPIHVVTNGMFNVLLSGDGTNPLLTAFDGPDRFLGLTIVQTPDAETPNEPEIMPRQRLVSAPFAIHSYNAYKAEVATAATTAAYADTAKNVTYATNSGRFAGYNTNDFLMLNKPAQTQVLNGGLTISGGSLSIPSGTLAVSGTLTASGLLTANEITVTSNVTANAFVGFGTIPIGGIILWSGATNNIPTGWLICDGTHSTPDLRSRFVVGAGIGTNYYAVGATGGTNSVTLTSNQIPAHVHGLTYYSGLNDGGGTLHNFWQSTSTGSTASAGGGQSHENRPPYYALCYIMRVK
ncbi:MAG TPA: hypothetical protein VJA21_28245 [Verrucomicrobiae bacterium]